MSLLPTPWELVLIVVAAVIWMQTDLPLDPSAMRRIAFWPFDRE
ncbi:MAG TPA: hypothetical protein VHB77_19820 [Planctomycetaceae bacterium]|nr:hypothetical protein [Planctomycetaceae bacterium]